MKLAVLGASGRTGQLIVEQALAAGHQVRALVRDPTSMKTPSASLEVVVGDATEAAAVARVAEGCDAVVSALGPSQGRFDVCSLAAAHVIASGVRRYVSVSGAGLDVPGDQKDLVGKIVSFMVRTLSASAFRDKVREHELLAASSISWTLVRPPRLLDTKGTGSPRVSLERSPSGSVSRADLAGFVLRAVTDDALSRKAPFLAA